MKKIIALIMILVLSLSLVGCTSGAGQNVTDATVFVNFSFADKKNNITLTLNKDQKILAVTYGIEPTASDSKGINKGETIYKDLDLTSEATTLDVAIKEIIKLVTAKGETALKVTVEYAAGKKASDTAKTAVASLKDGALQKYISEALKGAEAELTVKIILVDENDKENVILADKKLPESDNTSSDTGSTETTSSDLTSSDAE